MKQQSSVVDPIIDLDKLAPGSQIAYLRAGRLGVIINRARLTVSPHESRECPVPLAAGWVEANGHWFLWERMHSDDGNGLLYVVAEVRSKWHADRWNADTETIKRIDKALDALMGVV